MPPGGSKPVRATLQADGNLVLYAVDGEARWASSAWGPGLEEASLELGDDGNLVIWTSDRQKIWASGDPNGDETLPGRGHVDGSSGGRLSQ